MGFNIWEALREPGPVSPEELANRYRIKVVGRDVSPSNFHLENWEELRTYHPDNIGEAIREARRLFSAGKEEVAVVLQCLVPLKDYELKYDARTDTFPTKEEGVDILKTGMRRAPDGRLLNWSEAKQMYSEKGAKK